MAKTQIGGTRSPEVIEIKIGATVGKTRLTEPIETGSKVAVWRGQRPDGSTATVTVLLPGASKRERDTFVKAAERVLAARNEQFLPGVAPIVELEPKAPAVVCELSAAGTLADLPVLDWEFTRKLGFVRRLALIVSTMHKRGLFHGCMRPQNVYLDDQFEPVVGEVGALVLEDSFPGTAETRHEYWAYAAREVRQGQSPNARSDVFSLGRILHFVLTGEEPNEADENLPKLDRLADEAPGLVRIVRRATLRDAAQRYESVDQFLDELGRYQDANLVGILHPDGLEGRDKPRASMMPPAPLVPAPRESKLGEGPGADAKKAPAAKAEPPSKPDGGTKPEAPKRAEGERIRQAPMQVVLSTSKVESVDPISGTLAGALGAVGLLLCGGAAFLAYRAGEAKLASQALGFGGAVLVSAWLPGFSRWYLFRPVWIAACVALVLLGDPWKAAALAGRQAKFAKGAPGQRGASLVALVQGGRRDFRDLDLTSVDVKGQSLVGVDFTGAKLTGANFARADVSRVNFSDADIGHADFRGAKLEGAQVSGSIGWRDALCDEATTMPAGWACAGSNPKSDHDVAGVRGGRP